MAAKPDRRTLVLLLAMFLLVAGCGAAATPAPAAAPRSAPQPTTAPAAAAQSAPQPTAAPAAAAPPVVRTQEVEKAVVVITTPTPSGRSDATPSETAITASPAPATTATPTSTLAPATTSTPTSAPSPSPIVVAVPIAPPSAFGVDRMLIERGECVNFTWNIQNVGEIYFYVVGQPWDQHAATGEETREVCPTRSTGYELRIVNFDDSVEIRRLDVTVSTQPSSSITMWLSAEPSQFPVGACVMLRWRVLGLSSGVSVMRDEWVLWGSATQAGWLRDCPAASGDVVYTVVATSAGQSYQAQRKVHVGP